MPEGTLKREKLRYYFDQTRMLIVLIIIVAAFSILSPYFLKVRNLYAIGLTISVIGIVCIGQSLVLLTTGFDLSVGSISGLCTFANKHASNKRTPAR